MKIVLYDDSLLSKLTAVRPMDHAICWGIGRDRAGAEIRFPGSAVPIRQGPTPPCEAVSTVGGPVNG